MISYDLLKNINAKKNIKNVHGLEDKINELKERMEYFKCNLSIIDLRKNEDQSSAILIGAFNMFGQKTENLIKAYLSYANFPSIETWSNFRGYILLGIKTAWQIWCENDYNAPRSGEVENFPSISEFNEHYSNSVSLYIQENKKQYLDSAFHYYKTLYRGFKIQKQISKLHLIDDEEKIVSNGDYYSIIEYLLKLHKLNEFFFVIDEVSGEIYFKENIDQLFNS